MIEARKLTKRYGDKLAVDGLTFTVRPGMVTGFLGPNGAGKSTTMRMILGLDAPTSGSVLVNGKPVRSCVTPIGSLGTAEITTLEGLGSPENPHPLQKAFIDEQAMQCGFCINGVIMTAKALCDRTPNPSDAQIQQAMATVLCRCAAHQRIFQAIRRYTQSNAPGRTA